MNKKTTEHIVNALSGECIAVDLSKAVEEFSSKAKKSALQLKVGKTYELPIELVQPNELTQRDSYPKDEEYEELKALIKQQGQLTPVEAYIDTKSGVLKLAEGHTRRLVLMDLHSPTINVTIVEEPQDELKALVTARTINTARRKWSMFDDAKAYQFCLESSAEKGTSLTQEEIAQLFSVQPEYVSKCLSVYRLPSVLRAEIQGKTNIFTMGKVYPLVRLYNALEKSDDPRVAAGALLKVWAFIAQIIQDDPPKSKIEEKVTEMIEKLAPKKPKDSTQGGKTSKVILADKQGRALGAVTISKTGDVIFKAKGIENAQALVEALTKTVRGLDLKPLEDKDEGEATPPPPEHGTQQVSNG